MTQDERKVIVERLRDLEKFWASPDWVAPDWLDKADNVGKALAQVARDAADLIEAYEEEVAILEGGDLYSRGGTLAGL